MRKIAIDFGHQFDAISLEEMDVAAGLQRRFDNKYIVPVDQFVDVAARLQDTHRALDIGGRRAFDYQSVYFDSRSLMNYRSHIQQRRRRFKCRTRLYVDSDIRMFEVKLKAARGITVKKRMTLAHDAGEQLPSEARAFLRETLLSSYGYETQTEFVPVVTTDYRRVTLVSRLQQERLTCDFGLRFTALGVAYELRDEFVIVETKAAGGNRLTDQILRSAHVRPASLSKYMIGVSLTHPNARFGDVPRGVRSLFRPASPDPDRESPLGDGLRPPILVSERSEEQASW